MSPAAGGQRAQTACPLCGGAVPKSRELCASGCPLAKGCKVLCCESCGYEFVEDSSIVQGIGRIVRFFRRGDGQASADR